MTKKLNTYTQQKKIDEIKSHLTTLHTGFFEATDMKFVESYKERVTFLTVKVNPNDIHEQGHDYLYVLEIGPGGGVKYFDGKEWCRAPQLKRIKPSNEKG